MVCHVTAEHHTLPLFPFLISLSSSLTLSLSVDLFFCPPYVGQQDSGDYPLMMPGAMYKKFRVRACLCVSWLHVR